MFTINKSIILDNGHIEIAIRPAENAAELVNEILEYFSDYKTKVYYRNAYCDYMTYYSKPYDTSEYEYVAEYLLPNKNNAEFMEHLIKSRIQSVNELEDKLLLGV